MTKTASVALGAVSLDALDTRTLAETPFEFEYFGPDLKPSGLFFRVIGAQSRTFTAALNAALNEDRQEKANQAIAMVNRPRGQPTAPPIETVEEGFEFGCQMSAHKLVGWRKPGEIDGLEEEQVKRFRGLDAEATYANRLRLMKTNPHIRAQVDAMSDDITNFTKASPKVS